MNARAAVTLRATPEPNRNAIHREDRRRAHASPDFSSGLGRRRGGNAESPSFARIGRLKPTPPKQSELRSDGQARRPILQHSDEASMSCRWVSGEEAFC